jgi:ketosteroid isomerase-like protein
MSSSNNAVVSNEKLLAIVKASSAKWKAAFNSGDAVAAAAQYEDTAVMVAKPFGIYTGTAEIQSFWQKMVDDGFAEVDYVEPTEFEIVGEKSVVLTSNWKMNKAKGVITKELWVMQDDGVSAKLREDHFEAQS